MTTLYFKVNGGLQTGNVIIDGTTGNITGVNNANLGNVVTANYFSGDGSLLSNVNASNLSFGTIPSGILGNSTVYIGTSGIALNRSSGSLSLTGVNIDGNANYATYSGAATTADTVTGNAQPNITSVGTLSSLTVSGNITSGNISGGNLVSANYLSGTLTTQAQPNITSVGTLSTLDVTGNISTSGNIVSATGIYAPTIYGNVVGNISGTLAVPGSDKWVIYNQSGNAGSSTNLQFDYNTNVLKVSGNVTSNNANLGNLVTANYFSGDGGLLSNIAGGNVTGQVANALVAGTVYEAAQPNITSVGTLSSVNVTGNVSSGGNIIGNGQYLTGLNASNLASGTVSSTILGNSTVYVGTTGIALNRSSGSLALTGITSIDGYASTVSTAAQPNITSVGTMQSITMDSGTSISGGNLVSANYITGTLTTQAQPNITSTGTLMGLGVTGNLNITGNINVTGNLNYSNVTDLVVGDPLIYLGANNVSNIWDLGIVGSYNDGTYNHTGLVRNHNDGTWTVFDKVTAEPTTTIDWANATIGGFRVGNLTAGNVAGGNLVSANYISGDGGLLSNIAGANVTGQVGNALVAGTVYSNAQPNITSVGTLTSLTVSGNLTAGNLTTSGSGGNISGVNYVIANYFQGNGSSLSGLNASNLASGTISSGILGNSTVYVGTTSIALNRSSGSQALTGITSIDGYAATVSGATQSNITSVGTLNGLTATSTVDFTGASNVALGPVGNVHITGGSNGYLLQTDGAGALTWVAPPSTSSVTNGTSNVSIPTVNGNVNTSVGGTANVLVVTSTGANISGYVTATGNITAGNVSGGNLVSANYFSGDGGLLSNIAGANVTGQVGNALVAGTVYSNAQPNITSVGTLSSLSVTANVAAGNILTNNLLYANGVAWDLQQAAGNTGEIQFNNSGDFGATTGLTWNTGTSTLTATNFSGNGAGLSSITGGNVTGQVGNALVAGTVYSNAQPNITSVGTLSSLAVTGNATVGNLVLNGGIQSNRANVSVTTSTVVDEFSPSSFRTAKYVISASGTNGYQSAEIILVHDGVNSYISIYGSVCSNSTADIVDFSSNINGVSGNVSIYATASGASTKVNLVATYLKT